jgi:hypothetical protein
MNAIIRASQENPDGPDGLSRFASTVTRALRIRGERAYAVQLRGKVSTPRRRLSSSSHWPASGVMFSSRGTSKKAMGTPSGSTGTEGVPTIDHGLVGCKGARVAGRGLAWGCTV